jgi:hypothetical protein
MNTTLGAIAQIRPGYPFRSRVRAEVGGDLVVIQMKDVPDSGDFACANLTRVLLDEVNDAYLIRDEDIVLKGRGTTHFAARASEVRSRTVAAAPLICLRVRAESALPRYIQWWINHPRTQSQLSARAVGTYVQTLRVSVLRELEILLPPPSTQRQIVAIASLGQREHELTDRLAILKQRVVDSSLYGLVTNSRPTRDKGGG